MNIAKLRRNKMKISMKTMIPTTMLALSAMSVSSCGREKNNNITNNTKNKVELAQYDSTKANLPVIDGDIITYRNINGDIVSIKNDKGQTLALYKAINKFSTKENPNITESKKFFTEVTKNIPKTQNRGFIDESSVVRATNLLHSTILFNELYDIFTDEDSEKGETITVNEYTQMMDAWSSTGIRE